MTSRNRPRSQTRAEKVQGRPSSRDWGILVFFVLLACVLLVKLSYVQVVKAAEYSEAAKETRTSDIVLSARRGTIYDRNGNVLATSIDATTIYANPQEIADPVACAQRLAALLGGDVAEYTEKLSREDSSFVYIVRKADVALAESVQDLGLQGIYFLEDSKRVYPYGAIGSQIIGAVGTDDSGLFGLELQYDDILSGTDGELLVETGRKGIPISGGVTKEVPAENGEDIIVSVDLELQQYAEETLANAVKESAAKGGSITVMDATTGEIYASVSYPLVNADNWRDSEAAALNLKTISDAYEPGSTFKAVTAAAGVDSGKLTIDSMFTIPSSLTVADYVISDSVEHGELYISLGEIIARSSNIGVVLAERQIGDEIFYDYIKKFGFGEKTGVDFPGETAGLLAPYKDWSATKAANIPFGQGISVSPLQLIRAFGTFANEGYLVTPHFLMDYPHGDAEPEWSSKRIISAQSAASVTDMLEMVVSSGTGSSGQMAHYTVAGKTATAQYTLETGEYSQDAYIISFVGFLPETDSNLVCEASLTSPTTTTAAPLFVDVMGFAVDRYKIAPDS